MDGLIFLSPAQLLPDHRSVGSTNVYGQSPDELQADVKKKLFTISSRINNFVNRKAVKRNLTHFPDDFIFQLSEEDIKNLIFQNGISSWGGTRKPPYAFT